MLETLKEFASKKIELIKLEATEKGVVTLSFLLFAIFLLIIVILFIVMLNISLGLIIGHYLDNYGYGMLIISGFYLILIVITLLSKKAFKNKVAGIFLKFLNS